MLRKLIIGASVLALLGGQAQAATLQLQGLAAVDNGQGFLPAVNNMQLSSWRSRPRSEGLRSHRVSRGCRIQNMQRRDGSCRC